MNLNINYITQLLNYEELEAGLYIIPTPLGNLGDITLRALKILSSADLIICEDTRISSKLFTKFGIKNQMQSFHKFNSKNMIPKILNTLELKKSICLVSDAGTPTISDPGSDLIKEVINKNIKLFSLPGPSAPIASYVLSNFITTSFSFRGFFPRKKKEISEAIDFLHNSGFPVIFFESPRRIIKTLKLINIQYGECNITFVRELTKKHEEVINSNISDLIKILNVRKKISGEITIIIEPYSKKNLKKFSKQDVLLIAQKLSKEGSSLSEISQIISRDFDLSKREVYQLLIKNMK